MNIANDFFYSRPLNYVIYFLSSLNDKRKKKKLCKSYNFIDLNSHNRIFRFYFQQIKWKTREFVCLFSLNHSFWIIYNSHQTFAIKKNHQRLQLKRKRKNKLKIPCVFQVKLCTCTGTFNVSWIIIKTTKSMMK